MAFDAVLSLTLLVVAIRVLTTSDLFQAIVLFIVFGLLMTVAWTRLHAVDVAMAEVAIGAGLTGALFLNALGPSERAHARASASWRFTALLGSLLVLCLTLAATLTNAFLALPPGQGGLSDAVATELAQSGVSNPVTAVLLNFRAYDTLLEIAVLILAVAGIWALGPTPAVERSRLAPSPILLALVRILVPTMILVAGYLLWMGTSAPGGAFQAGAVLCAAGILLVTTNLMRGPGQERLAHRALIGLGFGAFLLVAVAVMRPGRSLLEYPTGMAATLIVAIEVLLTLSIAAILVALFVGGEQAQTRAVESLD